MAIPEYTRANFEIMLKAAANGDFALMECANVVPGVPYRINLGSGPPGIHRNSRNLFIVAFSLL